jgi:uncharacterized protein
MSAPHPPVPLPSPDRGGLLHTLTVWGSVAALSLAALLVTYFLFVEPPPPSRLVIAAGSKEGAYYRYAQRYAELLEKEGLTLEVRETQGSVENLRLLQDDDSGVSVAIVQSGLAGPEDVRRLQALGSLYHEPLWVFYRAAESADRLSALIGGRLAVGPPGSGTRPVAVQLLAANGVTPGKSPGSAPGGTAFVDLGVAEAAESLKRGEVDAAFFVAAMDTSYVHALLEAEGVRLMSFGQREAYLRRYRFLSGVTVPAGLVDLGRNVPNRDVELVATAATLATRDDLHPALVPLLLATAAQVHGHGDLLSRPGEFPSPLYTDLPLGKEARQYFKSGPPVLQRLLPFWLASLADRLKVLLIPLVMLLWPLLRAAPPLVRWRTRRKIYRWYAALNDIDRRLTEGGGADPEAELGRLRAIELQVAHVAVPLSYMEEFYNLRLHLELVRQKLENARAGRVPTV